MATEFFSYVSPACSSYVEREREREREEIASKSMKGRKLRPCPFSLALTFV
jgi:hypothetical protein